MAIVKIVDTAFWSLHGRAPETAGPGSLDTAGSAVFDMVGLGAPETAGSGSLDTAASGVLDTAGPGTPETAGSGAETKPRYYRPLVSHSPLYAP